MNKYASIEIKVIDNEKKVSVEHSFKCNTCIASQRCHFSKCRLIGYVMERQNNWNGNVDVAQKQASLKLTVNTDKETFDRARLVVRRAIRLSHHR